MCWFVRCPRPPSLQALPSLVREYHARTEFYRRDLMQEQERIIKAERERSHVLLCNILPPVVIRKLQRCGPEKMIAGRFPDATILFSDMAGFTKFASTLSPTKLLAFLNAMFSRFDALTTQLDVYKVEIIGDAYFVVAGCPEKCPDHAERIARLALAMMDTLPALRSAAGSPDINIRIGIHTGPVVAGVVGLKDPRYHLFGPTVTKAMAMESSGVPGKIHVSQSAYERLKGTRLFETRQNTKVIKGQPTETTYV